jgi:hypothetical protein
VALVALAVSLPGFFLGRAPAACSLLTAALAAYVLSSRRTHP